MNLSIGLGMAPSALILLAIALVVIAVAVAWWLVGRRNPRAQAAWESPLAVALLGILFLLAILALDLLELRVRDAGRVDQRSGYVYLQ